MTGNEICEKAIKLIESGSYVYWYGGKGEKCTTDLLNRLAALYPSVYNAAYKKKCRQDIKSGKNCIDCSGLVCKVYGWPAMGTWGIFGYKGVKRVGYPLNGSILWRSGHCGIYFNGIVLEARGKDYGLTKTRKYKSSDWSCVLNWDGIQYGKTFDVVKVAKEVISGKWGNGEKRVNSLKNSGYSEDDIKRIQKKVNELLK